MLPARPYFLDLRRIHLPLAGWVSILHRVSGALLAIAIPGLVYAWMLSLRSAADHARVIGFLTSWPGRLLALALAWALFHHYLAGLRHLALDLGLGECRAIARHTAMASLVLALLLTGLTALWMH